jgi:DNA polymerase V
MTARMYGEPAWTRARRATRAADEVTRRFGEETVRFAATGLKREWQTKRGHRTPRYTTCWGDLLVV